MWSRPLPLWAGAAENKQKGLACEIEDKAFIELIGNSLLKSRMNLSTDDGVNFITEETFDFGISFPAESQESLLENDTEEILIGPVRHSERCVAMGIDVNSNNGNQQKTNESVLKWSPLSAEKLVEIVKEANRLANQFEKCALKEKENAKRQGKECRSGSDQSKLEKESKAKIRLLQDERTCKKSPRSPRRDTFFVLDSPNKALLPSVNLQVISENRPISNTGQAHPNDLQIANCSVEVTNESEQITPDKPIRKKEGNLSTESKQATVKSVLSRPSGLKQPSVLNRKGNMHSISPSKPYQYPKKDSLLLPLSSTRNRKQTRGVSLNNPVNPPGKSTVLHNKQSKDKAPMMSESKVPSSSISFKPSTDTNIKLLSSASRAANIEFSSRVQPPSKLIPPGNRLRPGSVSSIRAGGKNERASSAVLKGKGSEKQVKTTVTSAKHLNSTVTASAIQNRPQPKKMTSSNVAKR
ncbi:proline/serine-rich coiled-coil protein 1-like isoform X2 [Heterodontus francisci]|uniref:proline/serine-rich coiled-coil protein 1-like isoform X2 n=1 Tax=Heterodontus francisci TaxID=7792 RepID=UPI00355B5A17